MPSQGPWTLSIACAGSCALTRAGFDPEPLQKEEEKHTSVGRVEICGVQPARKH